MHCGTLNLLQPYEALKVIMPTFWGRSFIDVGTGGHRGHMALLAFYKFVYKVPLLSYIVAVLYLRVPFYVPLPFFECFLRPWGH